MHQPLWINVETARRQLDRERHTTIRTLDTFLRAELAAAATYETARPHIKGTELTIAAEKNRASHVTRAVVIAQELERCGERPRSTAGAWGSFTKALARLAAFFGEGTLAALLRELERNTLEVYNQGLAHIDAEAREVVVDHLLAEQIESHMRLDDLVPLPLEPVEH
jgi:hypothetical protein